MCQASGSCPPLKSVRWAALNSLWLWRPGYMHKPQQRQLSHQPEASEAFPHKQSVLTELSPLGARLFPP